MKNENFTAINPKFQKKEKQKTEKEMQLENLRKILNVKKPREIFIEIDRKRPLNFNLNAMVEFQLLYGKSFVSVLPNLNINDLDPGVLRAFLCACFRQEEGQEEMTLQEAGKLVDPQNTLYLASKFCEAVGVSMPHPDDLSPIIKNKKDSAILGPAAKNE